MASQLGEVEHFDESTSNWLSYEERLAAYLCANKLPENLEADAFISLIRPKTFALLKSLTAPKAPTAKSCSFLLNVLCKHLSPTLSVIGERAKFHRRTQKDQETISHFVAELQKLAHTCEFGSFLDASFWDRFVCGLQCINIQRSLFSVDKDLTFQKIVKRALALESAIKNATNTHSKCESNGDLHKMEQTKPTPVDAHGSQCYRRESTEHCAASCPRAIAICLSAPLPAGNPVRWH